MINWMGGWPAEGLLAEAEWQEERQGASAATESGGADGRRQGETAARLRQLLHAGLLGPYWLPAAGAGGLLLADDADEALRIAAKALLRPGDIVLVERPTSRTALQLFARSGAPAVEIAGDEEGMDPEALGAALRTLKPRAVYVSLTCADPAGGGWSAARRHMLLRLCREAGTTLLLDERQSLTCEPPLNLADGEEPGPAAVVGALPPGLVSGVRLGWLQWTGWPDDERGFAPEPPVRRPDRAADALANREALLRYWSDTSPAPLLETLRFVYRTRHALLAEQLERSGIAGLSMALPAAGSHVWLKLPDGLEGEPLLKASWLEGLLFQPGTGYFAGEPDRSRLRLTPVHSDEREIREGVRRLERSIASFIGRSV